MRVSGHKLKHTAVQTLRRCVQLTVIGLMLGVAYLSLYAHYRAAHAVEDETQMTGLRGTVLEQLDRRINAMDDPQAFLDRNKGTVWSSLLMGVDLTDPLAAAEAVAASRTVYLPLLLSILVPVVVTLLLGKVFCSWICPASLLLELTGKLRKLLRFAELPPPQLKFSRTNKYVLLAVGLAIAAVVGRPIFALIYPPAALSRLAHAWVFGTSLAGVLVVIGVIVVFELLVSPRWWCRAMCPGGALYGLIGWPRLLRVKLDAGRCTNCRRCEPVCEPGLDPVLESYGIECDNCGQCVNACPERALRYAVGLPRVRFREASKSTSSEERGEGSDSEYRNRPITSSRSSLLALLFAVAVSLSPASASGHHILGLPHYSYKENYPQVPVLEYPATAGPYEVLFVCYPGKPNPGEQANLVFDIKNGSTGQRYEQPVTVRVLQTFTLGNNREVLPPTEIPAFDVLHKVSATFPEDGEYVVELTMDVEGREEVIGFLMIAGDPSATGSILVALGGGLLVFLIVVRAIKRKRDRRRRMGGAGCEGDHLSHRVAFRNAHTEIQ